jgi:glycosyltransferase involved in cell wall biosynthesis
MLSVIIPSRVDTYLQRTIDDLLEKAQGEIEIIVVLDGYWPEPALKNDPRVIVLHQGIFHDSLGMRPAINAGVAISRGKYIMKCDEHTMWDAGFDIKLAADCGDEDIIIPRRGRLDADKWEEIVDGRPPIDYMLVDYPYQRPLDKTCGLHGAEWRQRYHDRKDILVDETPTMQGSAYFMKKSYWNKLLPDGMDSNTYGPFTQEAQELSMAAWLSGGRVMVNKKVKYLHMHKGKQHGKGYGFSTEQYRRHCAWNEQGRVYCINHWLYTKAYKYDFKWFVNEKFPDMPGWNPTWEADIARDKEFDFSTTKYKDDEWLVNLREKA